MTNDPTVTTTSGPVRGRTVDGIDEYRGIPFASITRFCSPEEHPPWTDILECDKSYSYPQNVDFVQRGFLWLPKVNNFESLKFSSENELRLCIYATQNATMLPVMVYIHGGSYVNGGPAEYPGKTDFIKRGNVVLVSIQYRLGLLGFFSYEEDNEIFGNFGLQDQIYALGWIQKNIEYFGGNRNNITIFGESAGSFSVDALVRSPLSNSLFHKAIVQSGTLFSTWCPHTESNYNNAVAIFQRELALENKSDIRYALQRMTIKELIQFEDRLRKLGAWYLLRIDKKVIMPNFRDTKITIPYMLGRMMSEGDWLLTNSLDPVKNKRINSQKDFQKFVKAMCSYWTVNVTDETLNKLEHLYAPDENYTKAYCRWYGDWLIGSGVYLAAQTLIGTNDSMYVYEMQVKPIWHHSVEHQGNCHLKPSWCEGDHADDLAYVFGWILGKETGQNVVPLQEDIDLSLECIKIWTDFARNGTCPWKPFKTYKDIKILSNKQLPTICNHEEQKQKTEIFAAVFDERYKNI